MGIDRREWMAMGDWWGPAQCCWGIEFNEFFKRFCAKFSYGVFSLPQSLFGCRIAEAMCTAKNTQDTQQDYQTFHRRQHNLAVSIHWEIWLTTEGDGLNNCFATRFLAANWINKARRCKLPSRTELLFVTVYDDVIRWDLINFILCN